MFAGTSHSGYQPPPGVCFLPFGGRGGILSVGQQSASAELVSWGERKPEAYVVVPVVRRVVVAIGRTAVLRVVVPTAAPNHTVGASQDKTPNRLMTIRLNGTLSPASVNAISGSVCRTSSASVHRPSIWFFSYSLSFCENRFRVRGKRRM